MTILPVDVSEVMRAVHAMLKADLRLAGVVIERATDWNKLPEVNGWIGLYRAGTEFRSHTLGMGAGFRKQHIDLVILVQHGHPNDPVACEENLNALVTVVVSVLLTDWTLRGTVQMLDEVLSVRYESYEQNSDASYMQKARIFLTGLVDVRAQN